MLKAIIYFALGFIIGYFGIILQSDDPFIPTEVFVGILVGTWAATDAIKNRKK